MPGTNSTAQKSSFLHQITGGLLPHPGLLFLLILALGACTLTTSPFQIEVTANQASTALDRARSVLGAPYEWGGNGPEEFDCSGLIVWAYRETLGKTDIFYTGAAVVSDVTIQMFHDYNSTSVDDPLPGDLVFITDEEGIITHGGLVESITPEAVTFINASSYAGVVITDTWPLKGSVRDQWIAGFGRLIYCP